MGNLTFRASVRKCMGMLAICWLLSSCSPLIDNALPVDLALAKPPPTSCVGMNYAIKGVVYAGSIDSENTLSGVPVSFSQTSWCSPTAGEQITHTAEDGSFEFNVYIHDTDTLDFYVDMEGYRSATVRRNGLDYLAADRLPVELVFHPFELYTELAQAWQADIDQLKELLSSQKIPQHLQEQKPVLWGDEFDIMTVFDMLDHICMAEGYQLAYVYKYDPMGSFPNLYVHSTQESPFTSETEYYAEQGKCSSMQDLPAYCNPFTQYLVADGSELGYLQWVLLSSTGEQFYLDWHANYKDKMFIATNEALDGLVTQLTENTWGSPMEEEQAKKARAIDPTPQVIIEEETINIRVVWFTKWGGFFETEYVLSRTFPNTILKTNTDNLLEYNCGVVY